jgi:hypothetical protein
MRLSDRGILTITVLACAVAFVVGVLTAGWTIYGPTGRLTEDMAGWECHTMGNRQCGPGAGTIPPLELVKGGK